MCDLAHFSFGLIGWILHPAKEELPMSSHFQVLGGSLTGETHAFNPARQRRGTLVAWGFALASLWFGVAVVAAVTATAWAQGAVSY